MADRSATTSSPWQTPMFTGCDSVLSGPICLLATQDVLHLWVPMVSTGLLVHGGKVTEQIPWEGGQYLTIIPERLPGTLQILPAEPDKAGAGDPRWRLALADTDALEPALSKAREQRRERRLEDAVASLGALDRRDGSPRSALISAYEAHWAGLDMLGTGDADGALTLLQRALKDYALADRPQERIDAATIAVYLQLNRSEFSRAGALLEAVRPNADERAKLGADGRYLLDYYTGALASLVGDYRNALIHLERAARTARRLRLEARRQLAEQWLALQLQAVGRRDEADALLVALAERKASNNQPCAAAQLANNIGWNRLLALESRHAARDPLPPLREALAAYGDPACPATREQLVNARINLALAHLHAGQIDASSRLLDTLQEEGDIAPALALWLHDARGRVALARDDGADALRAYNLLERLAQQRYDDQARWRAQAGRARALEQLGDVPGALSAYDQAERLLAQQTVQVPVNAGRETFLARHGWVTLDYLRLLIAHGQAERAFSVGREARSRTLRNLRRADRLAGLKAAERARWQRAMANYVQARDQLAADAAEDWTLTAEALAPTRTARKALVKELRSTLDEAFAVLDAAPAKGERTLRQRPAGETQLLYLPSQPGATAPDRWLAFANSDAGLLATELSCPPDLLDTGSIGDDEQGRRLSQCLLEPFASHVQVARRLRILTAGALNNLDFHALPWRDGPLLAHAPVAYALDAATAGDPSPGTGADALVVADPRGDLPAARDEAQRVATLLEQQRPRRPRMMFGNDASLSSLREALQRADLFHYAGHAVFGGRGGWDSTLPLAGEDTFTVGDILALQRAPAEVVLSGCETGRADQASASQGIGIAHAFLAAGSRSVIAATRPVEDEIANALVSALYERWRSGEDTGQSLREAQLALMRQAPDEDWFSFRHMVL